MLQYSILSSYCRQVNISLPGLHWSRLYRINNRLCDRIRNRFAIVQNMTFIPSGREYGRLQGSWQEYEIVFHFECVLVQQWSTMLANIDWYRIISDRCPKLNKGFPECFRTDWSCATSLGAANLRERKVKVGSALETLLMFQVSMDGYNRLPIT